MKIVLDEGVPEGLGEYLPEHEVHSVHSLGWKGILNGRLLKLIEGFEPDTFVTTDKNMAKAHTLNVVALPRAAWPRNSIDHFILAKLEKENLTPSPKPDKATLLPSPG